MRFPVYILVFCAGFAALSWEVIWQLRSSVALGVSAWGTAVTLATTMGGMATGSYLMGRYLKGRSVARPLSIYGLLELSIGIAGLCLAGGFTLLGSLDASVYQSTPTIAPLVYALGIAALLGVPTMAMGATIPVFGLVAAQRNSSVSRLYALNTAGAAVGALVIALFLIPKFGIQTCSWLVSGINAVVALGAYLLSNSTTQENEESSTESFASPLPPAQAAWVVLTTGLATFALEVAWFRSLKAAFQSTTESFAVMLAAVLLALAVGARLAPVFRAKNLSPLTLLSAAGVLVLLVTPVVERFDLMAHYLANRPDLMNFSFFLMARLLSTFVVLGLPVAVLGAILPWLLDCQQQPRDWAKLYALNTIGSIFGALLAAWLLLPWLGFARTSWLIGAALVTLGVILQPKARAGAVGAAVAALAVAIIFESGIGRTRIQVQHRIHFDDYKILASEEGPDATVAVVETKNDKSLVIDGFVTTGDHPDWTHYMPWMGHLPMVLHPQPDDALVICFGTGQTANALRLEGAERLDVVDLSPAVISMAHLFEVNQGVLEDPKVRTTIMDGRAWMRRTNRSYDVITLEPMPPNFAGVNALYCKEFYQLAQRRLKPEGIVAQWVPFHLLAREHSVSIATTFASVFPNSAMWIDPVSFTGILVGSKGGPPLGSRWPGLERELFRTLDADLVRRALVLDNAGLRRYAYGGTVITDDNQYLAYGAEAARSVKVDHFKSNLNVVHWASTDPPPEVPSFEALFQMKTTPKSPP